MQVLATTNDIYNDIQHSWLQEKDEYNLGNTPRNSSSLKGANFFKRCEWTSDGSSLITSSTDYGLRLFVVPPTLLDGNVTLKPYTRRFFPSPVICYAVFPKFDLNEPSSCGVVVAHKAAPVKLYDACSNDSTASVSYSIKRNEDLVTVYSTAFSGDDLLCGAKDVLVKFDIHGSVILQVKLKGTVCALKQGMSLLAAGTFEGSVYLLDANFQVVRKLQLGSRIVDLHWADDSRLLITTMTKIVELNTLILENNEDMKICHEATSGRLSKCCFRENIIYGDGTGLHRLETSQNLASFSNNVSSVDIHPMMDLLAITSSSELLIMR